MSSPEYTQVEQPFIEQLRALGWDYLEGDTGVPYLTEQENFRQVLLTGRLREALARINLGENGEPWLDETRVNQAVGRLERLGKPKLIEANQVATDLLLVVVEAKRPDLEDSLTQAITQFLRYSNQREEVSEPEGIAAASRGRGDADVARRFAAKLSKLPHPVLTPLDETLAQQAADVAAQYRLRGSDAVYAAVALRLGSTLVTRDREQRERVADAIPARQPAGALAEWS